MKNDLKHGKGILYYPNGNIKYDGEFVNDGYEGKGKYIWESGNYYIGEFKNDLKQEKVYIIIQMEILNMMAILLMMHMKEKENIFPKMVNVI